MSLTPTEGFAFSQALNSVIPRWSSIEHIKENEETFSEQVIDLFKMIRRTRKKLELQLQKERGA